MIFSSLQDFVRHAGSQGTFQGVALTIGNFDGCHLGHRALIARSVQAARSEGLKSAIMTFDPHPEIFFGRLPGGRLLFTVEQKMEALAALGVDGVILQAFDQTFALKSATAFALELIEVVPPVRVVTIGSNFHFGAKRSGNAAVLREILESRGVRIDVADLSDGTGSPISSSRIRDMIASGRVEEAQKLLGAPYRILGLVQHGDKLGRTIGVPTANVGGINQLLPGNGVYAVKLSTLPHRHTSSPESSLVGYGVCNVGTRPTVGGVELRTEVHVLDRQDLDLYDRQVSVQFMSRLRDERKFSGVEELKKQIAADITEARKRFAT